MAIFKSSVSPAVGTSAVQVLTATKTITLIGVSVANIIETPVVVSVVLKKGGATGAHVVKGAPISKGDTLIAIGAEQKVVMEATDVLEVISDTAASVDVIVNYLEV